MLLIVADYSGTKLSRATREMVQAARTLGREGPITLLALGHNLAEVASEAALLADQVLVADRIELAEYDAELWASAVTSIAREGEAHTIFIAATRSGREYSPRVAVRLDAPLLEDAVSLIDDAGTLVAERYAFLGRATERIAATSNVVVATVKPGAFEMATNHTEAAEQYDVELELPPRRLTVTGRVLEKSERVSLTEADIVVSGGRGTGDPQGFKSTVEALAEVLGAAVGATRAVVDAGWRPYSEQVGQTGKTVQPKMYIALGISGAVQHLSGMGKSKCIVAINKDADAPIFKEADYGIVGDVGEVVPALIRQLERPQ